MVIFIIQIIILMAAPHYLWKSEGEGEGHWMMSEVLTNLFRKFFKMIGDAIAVYFNNKSGSYQN